MKEKEVKGIEHTQEPTIEKMKFQMASDAVREELGHLDLKMLGDVIYELDAKQYQHIPVDVETFIRDDYYLGRVLDNSVYPIWVDTLKKVYPSPFFSPYTEVIVSAAIGSGKCLVGNTLISTSEGILKIKDIKSGIVQSETVSKYINNTFDNGFMPTKTLKFYTGKEIEATNEHKFRVLDIDGNVKWKPVLELNIGDNVITQLKDHVLSKYKLEEGLSYFLGLLSGDGHVISSNKDKERFRKNVGMTIGHKIYNSEPEFMVEFTKLFKNYVGSFNYVNSKSAMTCRKVNKDFGQYLLEQGFYESKEVYLKRVPKCIFKSCKQDILEYLSGLIDTDGYVNKSIEIAFKYEPFAQDVQVLLSALGVYSRIKSKYNKKFKKTYYILDIHSTRSYQNLLGLNLRISYKREAFNKLLGKTLNSNTRTIYKNINKPFKAWCNDIRNKYGVSSFRTNRRLFGAYYSKQNTSLEVLQQIHKLYPDITPPDTIRYLIENNVVLDKIVSITSSEHDQHVYDIEVSEDHSYLVNGLVSHNSTMSTIGLVYDIYKILCLKNPQRYYGLMEDTKIVFMMFSRTKALAQGVNYEYLEKFFANSPFFQENVQLPRGKSQIFEKGIELTKNVYVEIGSQIRHALGKAVFGAVLDEANFQNENSNQAEETYNGILSRMKSRFMGGGGILPGTLYVMSSPKNSTSFLEDRIVKARKDPTSFVLDNLPIWEIKKHKLNQYSGEIFYVFMGSDTLDPCIVEDGVIVTEEMKNNLMEVPVEHYSEFSKDLMLAINDQAGRRTGSTLNFIKSKKIVTDMMVIPNSLRFTKPVIQLSFNDDSDTLMKYMVSDYFRNPYKKHCYRFIHIDLAKNRDRTGIGACFAEDIDVLTHEELILNNHPELEGGSLKDIYEYKHKSIVKERMYYIDWVLAIENVKGQDIPFDKVVDFIKYLKDIGYPIMVVTTDGYQGDYLRQRLLHKGLKAEYLSVSTKRNKQGRSYFINFLDLLKKQKVISVNHPILYKELTELVDDGETVSHPQISPTGGIGHDDVVQGAVGALTRCFQSKIIQSNTEIIKQMYSEKNGNVSIMDQLKNATKQEVVKEMSKKFYIKKYF